TRECQDPCCDTSTCKLKAGAECAEGECCHRCQLKSAGTLCRQKTGDCDLAEHCTGLSGFSPLFKVFKNIYSWFWVQHSSGSLSHQ
uniref:Disintegrin domain-containing protein n=1 Tax=Cynoglossus semilaevis TaxID=244447 RepID=A0A3P8VHF1_CYNSE